MLLIFQFQRSWFCCVLLSDFYQGSDNCYDLFNFSFIIILLNLCNCVSVSPAGPGKTMHCSVTDGSLNCLAVNHDCSQVVVAGRNGKGSFILERK